jgi:redox-sensitive bicupin YhaK (pirin superfamily)
MSNVSLIIEERAANIGNFMVGRLLPFRQKRAVGPFVFVDHMGPEHLPPGSGLDVGPHPHIGLSTLTYLFEGSILHHDSLGSLQEITPGAVNWMTAGKGVVHSERTPDALRSKNKTLHGLQIWVALPVEKETMDPHFSHFPASAIPYCSISGVAIKVIAGHFNGLTSPVPVHSPLYFLELKADKPSELNIGNLLFGESGLYILEGTVESDGETYGERKILVAKQPELCNFKMAAGTTVYIFGGAPFPEERYINWNFVSSDKLLIAQAIEDWGNEQFPEIPGETDRVPYPGRS